MTSTIDRPARTGRAVVRRLTDLEPRGAPSPRPAAVAASPAPDPLHRHREARARALVVLRLTIEVLTGRRPAAQLAGMVTGPVRRYVLAAASMLDEPGRRPGPPPRRGGSAAPGYGGAALRSIRICHPAAGVAEVSAVWRHHGRYRALAARFELLTDDEVLDDATARHDAEGTHPEADPAEPHRRTRWCCTALRLG
ncbi:MAG: hypothetical protein J2P19_33640 [Pseudonocardia sp.]|nr:hypothetical protein [Pseudonocardia sp.]